MNPIDLSLFANRVEAICDEMGATLQKAAFSPNIRDRLDFSCAIFDGSGELCAQAAHIPVHLGSMAFAMRDIVENIDWAPGDMVILNDPYMGGTHLPDVTFIAPAYIDGKLSAFVANRAHHADIGAETPGSMPISRSLEEEGLLIRPEKLLTGGDIDNLVFDTLMRVMRNPVQSKGDFSAQIAANRIGVTRLTDLIQKTGLPKFRAGLVALNQYAEQLSSTYLKKIPDGSYAFQDQLDDDGLGHRDIPLHVEVTVKQGKIELDFNGSASQVEGNINCPLSVTAAAAYYVFRCLMPAQTPSCAGSFKCININASPGTIINARYPAAVAAGNVETSMRIVDVILGALAEAIPDEIPAASYGTMNNIAMGSVRTGWDYYETIGGGCGASRTSDGVDAVQAHMTNTLNTPIESLELNYPLRINRYAIREHSGGVGLHSGGDGIVREYQFLEDAEFTLLSERRSHKPWGLNRGESGQEGVNSINGQRLPGKAHLKASQGDVLRIETPGGGGFGLA